MAYKQHLTTQKLLELKQFYLIDTEYKHVYYRLVHAIQVKIRDDNELI